MHYRVGLSDFSRADYTGYLRVNRTFAVALAKLVLPNGSGVGSRLSPDPPRRGVETSRPRQFDRVFSSYPLAGT